MKLKALLPALLLALLLNGSLAADGPEIMALPVTAASGSISPHLSKGHAGTIVLSWQEPQGDATRLRFSRLEESGWSAPRTVASGANWFVNWADFPSVMAVSETLWAAHWLAKRPGGIYSYDVAVSLSNDNGQSWSPAITPHDDGTPTEHGFVSLYPADGAVGLAWLDGRNTLAESSTDNHGDNHSEKHGEKHGEKHAGGHSANPGGGMTLRHARIAADGSISDETELDELVCDCCQTSVALARQGPVAVYRNRTADEIRDIYLTRWVDGTWQPGHAVHDDGWKISGCPVNGPAVAARGDTVAVAWFTLAGDVARVRFARSTDGGITFGPAVEIAGESPLGRVDLVLLDDGNAVVSWLDQDATGAESLKLRVVSADGKAHAPITLAGTESGRPGGFPQMQSDGRDLILAWTGAGRAVARAGAGAGAESTIRSARLILPAPALSTTHP